MASRRIVKELSTREVIDGEVYYRYRATDSFVCGKDFVIPKDSLSGLIHEKASLSPTDACWVDYSSIIDQGVSVSGKSFVESSLIQTNRSEGASIIVTGESIIVDTNINVTNATIMSCYIEKSGIVLDGTFFLYSDMTLVDIIVQKKEDFVAFRGTGYLVLLYKNRMTMKYNIEVTIYNPNKPSQPFVVSADGVEIEILENSYISPKVERYSEESVISTVLRLIKQTPAEKSQDKILLRIKSILKVQPLNQV